MSGDVQQEQIRELQERLDIVVQDRDILVKERADLTARDEELKKEQSDNDVKIFEQNEALRDAQEARLKRVAFACERSA